MRHCFLLLLFTITFKGFSIDIPSKIKQFPITKGLPYFTTQHKLDPKEALNRFSTDSISIFKTENLGLIYAGVWTKIKLTNATNESKTYYLEVAFPRFDSVKIYDINNQLKQICISGDGYNFSAKSFKHRNTVLSLSFAPNEEKELLLFAKKDGDMSLPLYLWDTVAHEEKTYNENLSFGLIFGLYLFAVIISIVLSISFKTKLHFFYTLYSSFMFLALLGNYGFSHQLLFPNNSFLNNEGFAIIAQITVISLLLFGSEFVGVSKIKFPKINFTIFKICIFPLILFTVLYIITLLIGSLEQIGYAMFKISLVLYIIGLGTLLTRTVIGIVKT